MLSLLPDISLAAWRRVLSWNFLERLLRFAAIVVGIACLVASLPPHIKLVGYPGPEEINEPAVWHETYLLANGRNPFAIEELPGCTQFFGPFYSYVVLTLKPVLGDGYLAHRLLNLLCIGGSLWLLGAHMRRLGASLGIILTSLSVLYWIVLDNIMITARPDALGWGLFLLSLLAPAGRNYATGASVISLICAVLAFQCKAYFALAGCATLLGVALLRSPRTAFWMGCAYFFALGASVAITAWFFPLYLLEVFVMQKAMVEGNSNDEISRMHTLLFLKRAWPFLAIVLAGFGIWLAGPARKRWQRWREGGASALETLRPASAVEVMGLVFVGHLLLVYFYMGRNGGAWFTYHIHLLFPLLLLMVAAAVRTRWLHGVSLVLLAVFAIASLQVRWAPTDSTAYQRLCDLVAAEPGEVFGLAAAVEPLETHNKRVYNNGFSIFIGFALGDDRPQRMHSAYLVQRRCEETDQEIATKVASRMFGLILTEEERSPPCSIDLIKANYERTETFQMPTYFGHGPVWVWRPKPLSRPDQDGPEEAGRRE
jgi:hypothetical protein